MGTEFLIQVSLWLSVALLARWLLHRVMIIGGSLHHWWIRRRMGGKILTLSHLKASPNLGKWLYGLLGAILGAVITFLACQWLDFKWSLPILLVLFLFLEEWQAPKSPMNLMTVMLLLDRVRSKREESQDFFGLMAEIFPILPPGDVQQALQEAIQRYRSGLSPRNCLDPLRKTDPLLDEFVLTLEYADWQIGPPLDVPLSLLIERAGKKWTRTSRRLRFQEHAWPYIHFLRGAILSGMAILTFNQIQIILPTWFDYQNLFLPLLPLAITVILLNLVLSREWLRRILTGGLVVVLILTLAGSFLPPTDTNLSETGYITHLPDRGTATWQNDGVFSHTDAPANWIQFLSTRPEGLPTGGLGNDHLGDYDNAWIGPGQESTPTELEPVQTPVVVSQDVEEFIWLPNPQISK